MVCNKGTPFSRCLAGHQDRHAYLANAGHLAATKDLFGDDQQPSKLAQLIPCAGPVEMRRRRFWEAGRVSIDPFSVICRMGNRSLLVSASPSQIRSTGRQASSGGITYAVARP